MLTYLKKAFGDMNERRLKSYFKTVEKINQIEDQFSSLSDEQLKEKTSEYKEKLQNGSQIEDIKIEAFATVREAAKRVLGMRHFDVQLAGGLVLADGNIAEMATGEGKTLVASLPSYLKALEGKGVHVITVNDYLAKRDREIIGQVHEFLGLSVGLNLPLMNPLEKKNAYKADITYGVGTEFGFDYLRDNMVGSPEERVQRPYHFAIIDEVDSVLIDEAKTPLIIAGKMKSGPELRYIAAKLAIRFEQDIDYILDEETKATSLTDEGIEKVEMAFGVDNLYDLEHQTLYHYVIQAVRAYVLFKKDVDYIIKDGKIMLVDMFTGRIMEGRTLSDGLHQAIEAKEGLQITEENKTQASITIQNYFRMYPFLSGMTGTAKTSEKEFEQVYGMQVVQVPTNRPKIRMDSLDRVYKTIEEKYDAVTKEVQERHSKDQPVLIGTTSILQSEEVAKYLKQAGLKFELLNAKSVEQEVRLISIAGQKGQITIATNMAGRGTDILLGEGVHALGGLHVIGTERHESRRIDDQLKGRSGRQGDPGSTQFFISLEDDMFRRFAKEELEKLNKSLSVSEDGLVKNKNIHEFVDRVQRIVEGANYSMREYNLKLDDVINEQRNIIYTLRNRIIENRDLDKLLISTVESAVQAEIKLACQEGVLPEDWAIDQLAQSMDEILVNQEYRFPDPILDIEEVQQPLKQAVDSYTAYILEQSQINEPEFTAAIKHIMTSILDYNWIQHIEAMTRLKEGIGLRSYQQEDPMRLYQNDGLELFTLTYEKIEKEMARGAANFLRNRH
ncbi:accessory Sec system translocase SecA2 [Bacillus sp. ISL-47]|uniref:accessory Sec system translocase SecA2 n=1 Tax=Bacillus sp. ISL-47 TaxID=2819130 RepID=UPI001BEAD9F7|nr:accessory Sec system translocase SecA2 [Bacillus sp. ISL-47]MBT2687188.1 accessory Sec system translocase SecA2 [Bacillus sp. ISL-47]MBT2709788.1 accessory Sec system translocase SecA2 [Pseudomonas sp. ISL-84]